MAQSSIVFLIDVNGIPRGDPTSSSALRIVKKEQNVEEIKAPGGGADESMELLPFHKEDDMDDPLPSTSIPPGGGGDCLAWLKEFVLVTLFKEANTGKDYDFSRVQWSFKFFDSSHHVEYRDGRSFLPFDNDSFTTFETQLAHRMKTSSSSSAPSNSQDAFNQYDSSRVAYLSDAIKIITGSLPWNEATANNTSLNFSRSFNNGGGGPEEETVAKNTVFAFVRVPRTDKQLQEFADLQVSNSSTKDFMGVLLPAAFSTRFHHKLRIQLNFVDMWSAPENSNHFYVPDWNGSYPRQIVKCLQYLGNGRVISVPFPSFTHLHTSSMSLGLLPYTSYLRSRLEVASQNQNENVPSHIQKLAPGLVAQKALKNCQKISPEFDTDSLNRSLKSGGGSVLEASFNSQQHQNKVLRPFRMSTGYHEEETSDRLDYFRNQRLAQQERHLMREREVDGRKRKRFEDYEEDYYHHHHGGGGGGGRRRQSHGVVMMDDMESDSMEIDSLCEREQEQRLENWVNEGQFTVKRKKSLEGPSSKAVPISRPSAASKSFHVFHEPAPKNASLTTGARAKKMLTNVERKMHKSAVVESKRRSSGGGGGVEVFLDMKRITQKQEKELSAIKHRLKTYLHGELEELEGDCLLWMEKFKDELRGFGDMILREEEEKEEPCLVALAQALVNYASVRFTPQKVGDIRKACGRVRITAKDLLEQLLLVDMTILNRRIIDQVSKDKVSPGSKKKIFAFRETELQIILRLEIAWCFFIEPDEEAMEELLQDIVQLLQIIAAYRTNPPIKHFVNSVLLPTYSQSSRFMRGLYKKMNLPLPSQLAMDGSPVPSGSRRDDDSSMISSTSSANLYPEDSASQLHVNHHHHHSKRHRRISPRRPATVQHPTQQRGKGGNGGSASKNNKRQIMVAATSNPKLAVSQQFMADGQKKGGGGNKVSPKRVRRNLFDVQKKDKKDSKTLLALCGTSSRHPKSPAFKSPKGKSSLSPSGFFRAARSRRQLVLSAHSQPQFGSPTPNNEVLCPESPATPGGALSVMSKYAATSTSTGSMEKQRVIQESPEVQKTDFDNRPIGRVASVSFYGSSGPKSRAWEKSETQLMAARIKDSVDLRCTNELSLSDLELVPPTQSPSCNNNNSRDLFSRSILSASSAGTPRTNMSFCHDSYVETNDDAVGGGVCGDTSLPSTSTHLIPHLTGPAPDLDNPNISALITSTNPLYPLLKGDIPLPVTQVDPMIPSTTTASPPRRLQAPPQDITSPVGGNDNASPSSTNFQTPSKRVQFNLNENLVNTPSSARRASTGTPKSILKETHDATISTTSPSTN